VCSTASRTVAVGCIRLLPLVTILYSCAPPVPAHQSMTPAPQSVIPTQVAPAPAHHYLSRKAAQELRAVRDQLKAIDRQLHPAPSDGGSE
jgi:hypothetical protein